MTKKKKAKVVELHPTKDFNEDELRQMWNFFRTPSYTLIPEKSPLKLRKKKK